MSEEEIDRKITVIFATDVVGYSKHMEADESGTVKNLRACEKILTGLFEKHKGRLFNTGGDSFLAEFPSAVSAVECAVEFQKAIKERNTSDETSVKLQFRIGINSGDVIKEKDNLLGDGVNIAARLEALAQSGGITISKVIYDYVKGKTQYEFNDLGLQKVKQSEFHAFDLLIHGNEKRKLKSDSKNKIVIFVAVLVILLSAVTFSFFLNPKEEEDKNLTIARNDTNKPIILVMPVQTLGLAQEGLDKAITESLISNISRYNGVKTLSSGISYEVQRRQYNRENLKNELGVTHLVKGSLQSVGQNNRLSLELTKINEETIIWSKQLEFELNQLFEIQDAASLELLNSIQINAVTGDVAAQTEKDFTTFQQFKLALNRRGEWRKWTSDGYAKSVQITSQLEDLGVDQYVILNLNAWNLHQKLLLRLSLTPEEDKKVLLEITEKLIAERGRANDFGIRSIVEMEHFDKDCSLAEKYAEKVIEMEPGGDSFTGAGFVYMRCGKLEKAAETWKAGLLSQPIDQGYQITRMYAPLLFRLKRYAETEAILENIIDDPVIGMNQPWIYASLLVDKGEIERAKFYFELGISRGASEGRLRRALKDENAIEKVITNLAQFSNSDQ